jgi:preprotein translocase SecE subunit
MAMAVAEKNLTESTPQNAVAQLAWTSILGTAYVYAAILVVFHGIPALWDLLVGGPLGMNAFVSYTLKFFLVLGAATGAAWFGYRQLARYEVHGTRAGIFSVSVIAFVSLLLFCLIGSYMETRDVGTAPGLLIAAVLPVVIVYFVYRFAFSAAFGTWMGRFEDQGWFTSRPFKFSQGVKVRRGTILGLLILGGCGIYTMINGGWLRTFEDWTLHVPFSTDVTGNQTSGTALFILPDLRYSLPLLLIGLLCWVSWRVVNWPAFADFLIATEAEMNKVSWTTRKRLVQDTVVVLVTVILLTVFLFIVDIMWIRTLSWSWINVLQIDPMKERAKLKEQSQW